MISSRFKSLIAGTLALVSRVNVTRNPVPAVWDGQYTHPTPENNGVEWKFFQLVADPIGDNPPASVSVLFYQGYMIQYGDRDPALPQDYIAVTASFSNGTTVSVTVPAESSSITAVGQTVTGTWGSVGRFKGSPDLSTYTAIFTAPEYGLEGSFKITSRGSPHLGCNTTTDTTFSSAIPSDYGLTPAEKYVYKELGWVTTIPGGSSSVHMTIQGSKLDFSGQCYHDLNYAPAPINAAVETWHAATGQLGPFDLTWIYVVPINSNKILTAGYLARDGVVLQQQCSVNGAKTQDAVTVTPYGIVDDTVSGDNVPAGYVVQYTLVNGEKFRFNFTAINNTQEPDNIVMHRWIGSVEGGEVGGETFKGPYLYEWLNPAMREYVPPLENDLPGSTRFMTLAQSFMHAFSMYFPFL